MSMSREEIQALIQLLDDPSAEVHQAVTQNLLDQGASILPELEAAWEESPDQAYQEKVIGIMQELQTQSTHLEMKRWIAKEQYDLLKGVYLLARYQYPDLTLSDVEDPLDKIIKDVWLELNNNLTALEKVRILNHIIFDVHGFSKNAKNFYSPRNSFINQVLETKKGNPISLSVVYSVIAQRLGLPIYGVNLPKNFILAYRDELPSGETYDEFSEDILFYINPFNRGAVLGMKEIEYFLKQQDIEAKRAYFLPCSNPETIMRMLHNLINAYKKLGYEEKVDQFEEVLKVVTTSLA